ncbi:hypothetical protein AB1E18_000897 [Capra hircus]
MKKQMLQSKMVFLACRASSKVINRNRRHPRELSTPGSEHPQPGRPGDAELPSAAFAARGHRPQKPHFIPALRETMAPSPPRAELGVQCAERRAARAAESSPRRPAGGRAGEGRPRPGSPAPAARPPAPPSRHFPADSSPQRLQPAIPPATDSGAQLPAAGASSGSRD